MPAKCPPTQFSPDIVYLGFALLRASLTSLPSLQCQLKVTSFWWVIHSGVPTTPSSASVIFYNNSQNSVEHFTYYDQLILKDTTQEQGEGTQSFRDLCSASPSQHLYVFTNEELSNSCYLGISVEVSLCRPEWLSHWPWVMWLSCEALSPPQRSEAGTESWNPLMPGLLVSSPLSEPI